MLVKNHQFLMIFVGENSFKISKKKKEKESIPSPESFSLFLYNHYLQLWSLPPKRCHIHQITCLLYHIIKKMQLIITLDYVYHIYYILYLYFQKYYPNCLYPSHFVELGEYFYHYCLFY